ncbi:MAG: pentapeptide repeat-containing protein [Cyanobacteria bacterium P01_G01_bin.19]
MLAKFKQLWKRVITTETAEGIANASEKVFDLAETLNDSDNQKNLQIKELVDSIPSLLSALDSPLGQVVKSSVPFLPIAAGLIKFAIEVNERKPTLFETVAIVSQVAYIESIKELLASESVFKNDTTKQSQQVQQQLAELEELEISDRELRATLICFHESKLAKAFGEVLSAKLLEIGINQSKTDIWVKRVAMNTQRYMISALVDSKEGVQQLIDWYSSDGRGEEEKYQSIDRYLEEIESLPKALVFKEQFTFQDIYVPLQATSLDKNGEEIRYSDNFVLEEWVQKFIIDPKKSDKVLFIQAGAGRGKSVFCRMFADWVRQNLHPLLTPIVIRLRDIENFEQSFVKTLSDALSDCDFVSSDNGWLTDRNTQYLFLLDGFDELRMEGRASGGIERFIRQVGQFQEQFRGKETGHRVIMTGRPIALKGISLLPDNLERVKLLPMNDEIQQEWLEKWSKIVIPDDSMAGSKETEMFKAFLSSENCPDDIKNDLAREPLLLYLLGRLHREKAIKQEDFDRAENSTQPKIIIYEKSLELVLKEQREESLQYQITKLKTDSLERILMEAGLCVVQSGGEYARVGMIETRLEKDDSDAAQAIKDLREKSGEQALSTALGAFYIRPAAGKKGGGFEFYHKSFSEFLCAKRLLVSLEEWTETGGRRKRLIIDDQELARQIYDLLGYGGLTVEIVEYLWGLLLKNNEFQPVKLFERLLDFYERWCDGEFIDAKGITLPQQKMHELDEQCPDRETNLGQRQVDIYAGLNIMILLLELHRYGQSLSDEDIKHKLTFYPCGEPNQSGKLEDSTKLSTIIGYCQCVGASGFRDIVGNFLRDANLRDANLSGARLSGARLDGARLDGANLEGANLRDAYLSGTNLSGARLDGARLDGAYLSGTNLSGARLLGVPLLR